MGATRGGFYFVGAPPSNKRKISTYFKGAPRGDITDISVINDLITFFGCGHTYKLKSNACIFTGAKPGLNNLMSNVQPVFENIHRAKPTVKQLYLKPTFFV